MAVAASSSTDETGASLGTASTTRMGLEVDFE